MAGSPEPEPRISAENSRDRVFLTPVERKLGVIFPGNQELFGIIGEVGRYPPDKFDLVHDGSSFYEFPDGTVCRQAEKTWTHLVDDAQQQGQLLFTNGRNDPNLSLERVQTVDGRLILHTKGITYKDFKVATTPDFEELIAAGEIDPHLMLAQCQVIRGNLDGQRTIMLTWRDPKRNEYKGDELHLVGGHHKRSEGDIWQTYLNEQQTEVNIPAEIVSEMAITGVGWNRELQKPELLAVVDLDPDYDMQQFLAKEGRGIKTFTLPDDPKEIASFSLACFPQVVPVGIAGLYAHLIVNHDEIGNTGAKWLVSRMKQETDHLRTMDQSSRWVLIKEMLTLIPQKTDILHAKVELPRFEDMSFEEQKSTIELHAPSYEALLKNHA